MSDNLPLDWSFGQDADTLRVTVGENCHDDTVDLNWFCRNKTLNKREAKSVNEELNIMHDAKRRKLVSIVPFVSHINQFAVGTDLLINILDDKGVFAYKTEAAQYYKVTDVLHALDLKANVADADTCTILEVDGLMKVGDIMRKIIPTCSFNGTGSQTDFQRLQQRPEKGDSANENGVETLPATLRETPAALQWQYGQDDKMLVAALEKFGIMTRMQKGKLMLDVDAISDFSIFTKEQALYMWSTIKVVEDHRGQLYIPLDAFVEFVNEKLFVSAQLVSDIPEADRIHVKGHVFDRRMLKSALYMVRFLINHPESGYEHRTGDFDLLRMIMFFQKTCASINAASKKKSEITQSNPELAAKYRFEGGNKGLRVTWAEFDFDWIDHMTGELAQAWKQSMRNLGRIVAVGNVRGIWQILENRQDIVRASASEKAMLADMNEAVEADIARRGVQLPTITAEQRVECYERIEKERLALDHAAMQEERRLNFEADRFKIRAKNETAIAIQRLKAAADTKVKFHEQDVKKEVEKLHDNAYRLQVRLENKKEATKKITKELSGVNLKLNYHERKITDLEKRLAGKDEPPTEDLKPLIEKDEQLNAKSLEVKMLTDQLVSKDDTIRALQQQLLVQKKRKFSVTIEEQ